MIKGKQVHRLVRPFRIEDGRKFRLRDINPGDSAGIKSKKKAEEWLARSLANQGV